MAALLCFGSVPGRAHGDRDSRRGVNNNERGSSGGNAATAVRFNLSQSAHSCDFDEYYYYQQQLQSRQQQQQQRHPVDTLKVIYY